MLSTRAPAWRNNFSSFTMRLAALGLTSEIALVGVLIFVDLVAHGLNLFAYPSITLLDDEGTYVASAWALLTSGQLSHYTYTWGQAPAGWILLSLWMLITGGARTFGLVVYSGRVLVLLLHLGSVPLLYHV